MTLKVELWWSQPQYFNETIELDDEQVAEMAEQGVDLTDPQEIFEYLSDADELFQYEPYEWGASTLDESETCISRVIEG